MQSAEDQDPTYFRLVSQTTGKSTRREKARAQAAASYVIATLSGVRVPLGEGICATVELFLPSANTWPAEFARALSADRGATLLRDHGRAPPDMLAMLGALLDGKGPTSACGSGPAPA